VSDHAKAIKLGSGLDPTTQMGPMVSEIQRDRVCGYLESGKKDGARAKVPFREERHTEPANRRGLFLGGHLRRGQGKAAVRALLANPVL